ncbi:kelch repeat and BTB domain-containing protein 8-like [Branchiostoma lanceolatum]|uniref:kelch repeat and BTB domain-containing protein 8-like n=1 Tax=Branchiostoma lanceolatum TaxID=7740 RepID=UPI00345599B2
MFTSGYAEAKQEGISIQDVSEVAMATILDYAYTGCLQTEPDQVQAVMSAARLLQINFVCGKAAEYMKDKLEVTNCADVLMYANMLADSALLEASGRYMASRFNQVVLQPAFLQLTLHLLQSLLNRDDLVTNSEDYVVRAVLRWIQFEQEERLQHLPALCRCFRRSFISSDQLAEIENKCPSIDCKLVYSDSRTQRLGQVRTEMQIFLRENYSGYNENSRRTAPCYDPSAGKRYGINMPHSLENFSVTTTPDDELYLAGGCVMSGVVRTRQKTFYQYNHLFNTWEPRCEMIAQRARCGLVYLKGYIYAIGGDREITTAEWTAERYDPSLDEWTSIPPPPQSVFSELCAVTLDDSIYVISQEGCFSFSTTDNTWSKIQNMWKPAVRPQAIVYQGCIYCMDCYNDSCGHASPYIEVYTPTNDGGYWLLTGKRSVTFDKATMMKYADTIYILILLNDRKNERQSKMFYIQYRPETESWRYLQDKGRMMVPPMTRWMDYGIGMDCVTARMTPKCLGDDFEYRIFDVCLPSDNEDESGSAFSSSESSGSEIKDDSHCEDDVSDQEDNDEDNNDNDRGSGGDSGDI